MLKSVSNILKSCKHIPSRCCSSIRESRQVLRSRSERTPLSIPFQISSRQFSSTSGEGMDFADEKAKYLNLSLEEKRSEYHCKSNFATLENIIPWSEYIKKVQPTDDKPLYPINPTLNEKVSIFVGDITALEIDAIVNAANTALRVGGGVDGAIHRAAGKKLSAECRTLGGCEVGNAKITGGYKLPAKYVIHTVGPFEKGDDSLENCYRKSMMCAKENGLRTIAFPCISTGVYNFPNERACSIALKAVREFLEANESSFDRVIFCLFLPVDIAVYEKVMHVYFPV